MIDHSNHTDVKVDLESIGLLEHGLALKRQARGIIMSKILIVDDRDEYAKNIAKFLINAGHKVAVVEASAIPQNAIDKVSSLISTIEEADKKARKGTDVYGDKVHKPTEQSQ